MKTRKLRKSYKSKFQNGGAGSIPPSLAQRLTPKPAPRPVPRPPLTRPLSRPAPRPIPRPILRPVPRPAPRPVLRPVPRPVPRPAQLPAPRPVPLPALRPALRPAPYPVPRPVPRPSPAPAPASAPASDIAIISRLSLDRLDDLRANINTLIILWGESFRAGDNSFDYYNGNFRRYLYRDFNISDSALMSIIDNLIANPTPSVALMPSPAPYPVPLPAPRPPQLPAPYPAPYPVSSPAPVPKISVRDTGFTDSSNNKILVLPIDFDAHTFFTTNPNGYYTVVNKPPAYQLLTGGTLSIDRPINMSELLIQRYPDGMGSALNMLNNKSWLYNANNIRQALQIAYKFTNKFRIYTVTNLNKILEQIDILGYNDIEIMVDLYTRIIINADAGKLDTYTDSGGVQIKWSSLGKTDEEIKNAAYQNSINKLVDIFNMPNRPPGANISHISLGNENTDALADPFKGYNCHPDFSSGRRQVCTNYGRTWPNYDRLGNFIDTNVYRPFFGAFNDMLNQVIVLRQRTFDQTGRYIKIGICYDTWLFDRDATGLRVIDKHYWTPFFSQLDFMGLNRHPVYMLGTNWPHDDTTTGLVARYVDIIRRTHLEFVERLKNAGRAYDDPGFNNKLLGLNGQRKIEIIYSEVGLPTVGYTNLNNNAAGITHLLDSVVSAKYRHALYDWFKNGDFTNSIRPTEIYWQSIFDNHSNPGRLFDGNRTFCPPPTANIRGDNCPPNPVWESWGSVSLIENGDNTISYFLKSTNDPSAKDIPLILNPLPAFVPKPAPKRAPKPAPRPAPRPAPF